MLGNFACFFVVCGFFFFKLFFQKSLSGIQSECQKVWLQIRPDVLSGLILVQTVCKGYQQLTKVTISRERVKGTKSSANHNCSRQHFLFSEKIRFDISCESSARQMIHMKCQALFSLKITVVCYNFAYCAL